MIGLVLARALWSAMRSLDFRKGPDPRLRWWEPSTAAIVSADGRRR